MGANTLAEDHISQNLKEKLQAIVPPGHAKFLHRMPFASNIEVQGRKKEKRNKSQG
jgi:hypothetical protein